jgi:hypothetical protein
MGRNLERANTRHLVVENSGDYNVVWAELFNCCAELLSGASRRYSNLAGETWV